MEKDSQPQFNDIQIEMEPKSFKRQKEMKEHYKMQGKLLLSCTDIKEEQRHHWHVRCSICNYQISWSRNEAENVPDKKIIGKDRQTKKIKKNKKVQEMRKIKKFKSLKEDQFLLEAQKFLNIESEQVVESKQVEESEKVEESQKVVESEKVVEGEKVEKGKKVEKGEKVEKGKKRNKGKKRGKGKKGNSDEDPKFFTIANLEQIQLESEEPQQQTQLKFVSEKFRPHIHNAEVAQRKRAQRLTQIFKRTIIKLSQLQNE